MYCFNSINVCSNGKNSSQKMNVCVPGPEQSSIRTRAYLLNSIYASCDRGMCKALSQAFWSLYSKCLPWQLKDWREPISKGIWKGFRADVSTLWLENRGSLPRSARPTQATGAGPRALAEALLQQDAAHTTPSPPLHRSSNPHRPVRVLFLTLVLCFSPAWWWCHLLMNWFVATAHSHLSLSHTPWEDLLGLNRSPCPYSSLSFSKYHLR